MLIPLILLSLQWELQIEVEYQSQGKPLQALGVPHHRVRERLRSIPYPFNSNIDFSAGALANDILT